MSDDSERSLAGTPYLTQGDAAAERRFDSVSSKAIDVQTRALAASAHIAQQAQELLGPYTQAVRADLVLESNRIEGYEYSSSQIRELIATHREMLNAPVGNFMNSLREDRKVYLALDFTERKRWRTNGPSRATGHANTKFDPYMS